MAASFSPDGEFEFDDEASELLGSYTSTPGPALEIVRPGRMTGRRLMHAYTTRLQTLGRYIKSLPFTGEYPYKWSGLCPLIPSPAL